MPAVEAHLLLFSAGNQHVSRVNKIQLSVESTDIRVRASEYGDPVAASFSVPRRDVRSSCCFALRSSASLLIQLVCSGFTAYREKNLLFLLALDTKHNERSTTAVQSSERIENEQIGLCDGESVAQAVHATNGDAYLFSLSDASNSLCSSNSEAGTAASGSTRQWELEGASTDNAFFSDRNLCSSLAQTIEFGAFIPSGAVASPIRKNIREEDFVCNDGVHIFFILTSREDAEHIYKQIDQNLIKAQSTPYAADEQGGLWQTRTYRNLARASHETLLNEAAILCHLRSLHLPQLAELCSQKETHLDARLAFTLLQELGPLFHSTAFKLLFDSYRDGNSFQTVYKRTRGAVNTLIIFSANESELFGFFTGEGLKRFEDYYGGHNCFAFFWNNYDPLQFKRAKWIRTHGKAIQCKAGYIVLGSGSNPAIVICDNLQSATVMPCDDFTINLVSETRDFAAQRFQVWQLSN